MSNDTISETPQQSTRERIAAKLAKLKDINRERPCSECVWHHAKGGYSSCDAAIGSCNFNHDRFERIADQNQKLR